MAWLHLYKGRSELDKGWLFGAGLHNSLHLGVAFVEGKQSKQTSSVVQQSTAQQGILTSWAVATFWIKMRKPVPEKKFHTL